ncbi:MAG: hypothetical protein IAB81_01380 [Bacteroidetes bacterium]|uniref:Uncharacterized protein n=1 Tax=Candidatus Merdivivens pullicola TaxID=2840872 RepID=A0A9D9IGH1_9BACT|nr:hypothetical protein [Candidatus Merdivivens pullicola]
MNPISRHIRKRKESLFAQPERRAVFMTPEKASQALVVCDKHSPETEEILKRLRTWTSGYDISMFTIFFSLDEKGRSSSNETESKDSVTIYKNDINIFKIPDTVKLENTLHKSFDLLICLMPASSYPVEFIVKCCTASFKTGISDKPDGLFDLVVAGDKGVIEKTEFLLKTLSKIKND